MRDRDAVRSVLHPTRPSLYLFPVFLEVSAVVAVICVAVVLFCHSCFAFSATRISLLDASCSRWRYEIGCSGTLGEPFFIDHGTILPFSFRCIVKPVPRSTEKSSVY